MGCPYCEQIEKQDKNIIYEDNLAVVMLAPEPAAKGHLIIMPRQHHIIIEQIPDNIVSHLFLIANKASSLVFETLGTKGTNITVNNGVAAGQEWPHFAINVIPRNENDNIDFNFNRSKSDPNELEDIAKRLKEETDFINQDKAEEKTETIEETKSDQLQADEEDYRLKQVRHIP